MGLNMHSADEVPLDYQDPKMGDTIGNGRNTMRIERVSRSACSPGAPRTATGSGHPCSSLGWLDAADQPQPLGANLAARVGMVAVEPASLVMERKMLRGIKERAERLASRGS